MKIRSLLTGLVIVMVSMPILWLPVLAEGGRSITEQVAITNGKDISLGENSFFALLDGGTISGHVYSEPDGAPIGGARVVASDRPKGEPLGWAVSGWDGTYIIAGLAPGTYYLAAAAEGYKPEYYDGVVEPKAATPVSIADSTTTDGIDFTLMFNGPPQGEGSISGKVVDDSTGRPIEGANVIAVTLYNIEPDPTIGDTIFWMGEAITGPGGVYRIEGLISGKYLVSVSAYDYLPEFYDDVYNPEEATTVPVEEPGNTPNIDFGLSRFIPGNGIISGVVLTEADSTPVKNAWVMAYSPDNPFSLGVVESRSDGSYWIGGLMTGDYLVVARAFDFSDEWYEDAKTEEEATPVSVFSPEETPGIDFYLGYLGSISGRVMAESDGSPVEGAIVCAFPAEDSFYTDPVFIEPGPGSYAWPYCAVTDSNGDYMIRGIYSGEYKVHAWALGFINEWFDDVEAWEEATVVSVVEPDETTGIDFALGIGASISGRVTGEGEGEPVAGAWVCVSALFDSTWIPEEPFDPFGRHWDRWGCAETDGDGYYRITGLDPGEYYVHAWAEGYLPEWYDGVQFWEEATAETVVEETETPDVDFILSSGGTISGTVVGELAGVPLHAHVCAVQAADSIWFAPDGVWSTDPANVPIGWARCAETDRSGQYTIEFLPSGEYFVFAWVEDGYLPEWYDDVPTWKEATLVTVIDPEETPGIDFELSMGGRIEGRVVSRNQETPVVGATVCAFQIDETDAAAGVNRVEYLRCAETDDRGRYVVTGLKTGSYFIVAYAWGYQEQWYEMAKVPEDADPVKVEAPGLTTGIDFALMPWGGSGSISGRVSDSSTGQPIQEAYVEARRGDGWWTGRALTHEDGTYVISDLPSGNYYVSVKARGYAQEFYDNVHDPRYATYVPVNDPYNTPDINFELEEKNSNQPEGGIAGRVTTVGAEGDTAFLSDALVVALAKAENGVREDVGGLAVTDERGFYVIPDLPAGQYYVSCFAVGYIGEVYDDVLDPREATLVKVVPPDVTESIDFELAAAHLDGVGRITGMIYEADGVTPAADAWVYALNMNREAVAWDKTGPDGNYVLSGLAPGQYVVQASKMSAASLSATYSGNVENINESSTVAVGAEIPMDTTVDIVLKGSTFTSVDDDGLDLIPEAFGLDQNYPNPFNPETEIRYQIPDGRSSIHTTLKVYNLLGQEVRTLVDEPKAAGYYTVTWDGRDQAGNLVATGFYFCRLQAGEYAATIKMVLMK